MSKSQTQKNNRSVIRPLMIAIVATTMIIIFTVIALLFAPVESIPEFEITDRKGSWEAQGRIAVFDDKIGPGSKGEYHFVIRNDSDANLRYGIDLSEFVNSEAAVLPFMQYRLKMNGVNIDDDEEWHSIDDVRYYNIIILPDTKQLMTLEWRWPFDEDDERDTLLGRAGGSLSVVFFLWAEVVDQ